MIALHQLAVLLMPAIIAGVIAVALFQIIDRLNLFYQKEHHQTAKKAA
jgi:predicted PurR-regulated permease PerM